MAAATIATAVDRIVQSKSKQPRGAFRPFSLPGGRTATTDGVATERKVASAARSASASVVPAPVAAGMMMRGNMFQFGAAPVLNGQTGVRVAGRQIWCAVTADATTAAKPLQPLGSGGSNYILTFDPDDNVTMPPPLTQLSQIFGRYCLRKCKVIFTPAAPTSSTVTFSMAVLTDAASVQTWASVRTPSVFTVMEQSNASTGPVWGMQSIEVPCDQTLRFSYQTVTDGSLSSAEERQDHAFGMVAFLGGSPVASTNYGYLHIEYCCDFYEVISQPNESSLLRRLAAIRSRKQSPDDEKKEDRKSMEVIVVDETHTPPPSSRASSSFPPVLFTRPVGKTASAKA